jgi:hypothetical protein
MVSFICIGFGGLLLGFLPFYWCLLMPKRVNYQGDLPGASWLGGVGSARAVLWPFLSAVFPYAWGLPQSWMPSKWKPCKNQGQHDNPHGENEFQIRALPKRHPQNQETPPEHKAQAGLLLVTPLSRDGACSVEQRPRHWLRNLNIWTST